MKNEDLKKKSIWESRAVMTCVIAVTAFLCSLTMMQLISIKVEARDSAIVQMENTEENTQMLAEETERENRQPGGVSDKQPELSGNSSEEESEIFAGTEINDIAEEEVQEIGPIIKKPKQRLPYYLKINRQQNVVTVYGQDEKGEYTIPVKAILCSTGRNNATPKGIFRLSEKYVWRQLYGGVYGQEKTDNIF